MKYTLYKLKNDIKNFNVPPENKMAEASIAQNEYLPIEFFLSDIDTSLVVWICDQVGCLRSVFKIYDGKKEKDVIYVGDTRIKITKNKITADDIVSSVKYDDNVKCFHLKDGTVVIFIRNDELKGYHFCFEDAPNSTFNEMSK